MIRMRAAERDRSGEGQTPTLGLTVQPLLPNPATPRPTLTKDPCDLMPYPQSKIQIPRGGPVSRKINPGTQKPGATQHRALGAEALRSPKKQATGQRDSKTVRVAGGGHHCPGLSAVTAGRGALPGAKTKLEATEVQASYADSLKEETGRDPAAV